MQASIRRCYSGESSRFRVWRREELAMRKQNEENSCSKPILKMDTVEIDPELFITCRICLNEKGSFQITPFLQEQINYCLDAVVQPFDGFSQVICKKCKPVLHCFYNLKKNFKDKQNNLKKNPNDNIITKEQADQYVVTSSQQEENTDKNVLKVKIRKVKTDEGTISCISSDSESNTDSLNKKSILNQPKKCLEKEYQKYFVCRYCDKHCNSLSLIIQHLQTHKHLLSNYKKRIQKHCNITLNRVDDLPNITGYVNDTNIVVLDSKTFIYDGNNINYYITYLPKAFKTISSKEKTNNEESSDDETRTIINDNNKESSDEESLVNVKPRKRARFLSCSEDDMSVSPDLVKNDNKTETETNEFDYKKIIMNPQLTEKHKAHILNIVLGSYNKSIKKINSNKINLNEVLNRKVLGIGRKVMSKVGMPSQGLLKYLEYKNLSIEWTLGWQENDYVRIMTNIKEKPQPDNFVYLDDIKENDALSDTELLELKEMLNPKIQDEPVHEATITKTTNDNVLLKTFLLNTCPVPNPKQAPQKKVIYKTIHEDNSTPSCTPEYICVNDSDEDKSTDIISQLPIITSTTSLAPNANTNVAGVQQLPTLSTRKNLCDTITDTTNKPNEPIGIDQPRLKCKPVSELMATNKPTPVGKPPPPYYSVHQTQKLLTVGATNGTTVIRTPTVIQKPAAILTPTQHTSEGTKSPGLPTMISTTPMVNEYITLDTGLMPNTSTSSPITYFQKLLQSYGLVLLDSLSDCALLCCLIKFKLNIKHDMQSVLLNLSLFALNKDFCIKVKNGNSDYINISQMSANWQWELIRAFQDNVVLEKAQNASNLQNASEFTKLFISILKSIKRILNQEL